MAIRRSKTEWQTLIEQQQNSHLSQKLFCQQQNVSVATFGYWKRKLQQEAAIQPTGNEATSSPDAWLELPSLHYHDNKRYLEFRVSEEKNH